MKLLYISTDKETKAIDNLEQKLKEQYPDITALNTLVLMVSPDYSATVAMKVAHFLSINGEMCDILPIHVPYPDETADRYIDKAKKDINAWIYFSNRTYDNYLLVEAGVIKGGTYTWLTNVLKENVEGNIITAALFENINSKFKSDIVSEYYNNDLEDLTFYFEKYNKHWS